VSAKDVLVGVGFVLAAAAFLLSLRNARQLRELRRRREGVRDGGADNRPSAPQGRPPLARGETSGAEGLPPLRG
jgi:HAMP domain-containing protein